MEVTNLLILALDLGLVKQQDYENHRKGIEKLSNGINALRKAQLKRLNN